MLSTLNECVCEFNKADFYEVILRIFRLSFNRSPHSSIAQSQNIFLFLSFFTRSLPLSFSQVDYAKRAIFTSFCRVRFMLPLYKKLNCEWEERGLFACLSSFPMDFSFSCFFGFKGSRGFNFLFL